MKYKYTHHLRVVVALLTLTFTGQSFAADEMFKQAIYPAAQAIGNFAYGSKVLLTAMLSIGTVVGLAYYKYVTKNDRMLKEIESRINEVHKDLEKVDYNLATFFSTINLLDPKFNQNLKDYFDNSTLQDQKNNLYNSMVETLKEHWHGRIALFKPSSVKTLFVDQLDDSIVQLNDLKESLERNFESSNLPNMYENLIITLFGNIKLKVAQNELLNWISNVLDTGGSFVAYQIAIEKAIPSSIFSAPGLQKACFLYVKIKLMLKLTSWLNGVFLSEFNELRHLHDDYYKEVQQFINNLQVTLNSGLKFAISFYDNNIKNIEKYLFNDTKKIKHLNNDLRVKLGLLKEQLNQFKNNL